MMNEERYFRAKDEEAAIEEAKAEGSKGKGAGAKSRGLVIDTRNMSSDELRSSLKSVMGKMVVEQNRSEH